MSNFDNSVHLNWNDRKGQNPENNKKVGEVEMPKIRDFMDNSSQMLKKTSLLLLKWGYQRT